VPDDFFLFLDKQKIMSQYIRSPGTLCHVGGCYGNMWLLHSYSVWSHFFFIHR